MSMRRGRRAALLALSIAGVAIALLASASISFAKHKSKPHPVTAIVVSLTVTGTMTFQHDDAATVLNGGCGSGDPTQDSAPTEDHKGFKLKFRTVFPRVKISLMHFQVEGASGHTTLTGTYAWRGFYFDQSIADCTGQQPKVTYDCNGTVNATTDKNNASITVVSKRGERAPWTLDKNLLLAATMTPPDCRDSVGTVRGGLSELLAWSNGNTTDNPFWQLHTDAAPLTAENFHYLAGKVGRVLTRQASWTADGSSGIDVLGTPIANPPANCSSTPDLVTISSDQCSQSLDWNEVDKMKVVKRLR